MWKTLLIGIGLLGFAGGIYAAYYATEKASASLDTFTQNAKRELSPRYRGKITEVNPVTKIATVEILSPYAHNETIGLRAQMAPSLIFSPDQLNKVAHLFLLPQPNGILTLTGAYLVNL